jgi:hypothetical protein
MAHTTAADLAHAPVELLLAAMQERQPRLNSMFNSPLVIKDGRNFANRALEDGAVDVEIPLLSPVLGGYTLQNPGNPPVVDNITSGRQKAPAMYREKAWGRDAFAASQTGLDPFAYIVDRVLNVRLDDAEKALINILDGIFKSSDFADLIFDTEFSEDAVDTPADAVYWDSDVFHDTTGVLGIKEDDLVGGIITMHSKIRTNLKKLDELDTVKPSEGGIPFNVYKGMRVVVDDRLVRAGADSGFVYPITIAGPQTIIFNIATQGQDGTTSSSLAYDSDIPNLRKALYDRIVALCHVNGTVWKPTGPDPDLTIAKGGPTDAQFATAQAWETAYVNVKETRIVRAYVNG